jgi:hypothetical protein
MSVNDAESDPAGAVPLKVDAGSKLSVIVPEKANAGKSIGIKHIMHFVINLYIRHSPNSVIIKQYERQQALG